MADPVSHGWETTLTHSLPTYSDLIVTLHLKFATLVGHSARAGDIATLKVYPGAPHGVKVTHIYRFNDDLLTFVKGLR